jgi:Protein of unknown function (DUF2958)
VRGKLRLPVERDLYFVPDKTLSAYAEGARRLGHINLRKTMTTNITATHRKVFEAMRDSSYTNFALFSCFVNGESAAAIVTINRVGEQYTIAPLFVSVTRSMILTDHQGRIPDGNVSA